MLFRSMTGMIITKMKSWIRLIANILFRIPIREELQMCIRDRVDTEFNDVAKVKFALPGITPQYCASYALEQMRKRKTIIVPKFTIRAATTMARFVPQKMLIPVIGQLQKKKF